MAWPARGGCPIPSPDRAKCSAGPWVLPERRSPSRCSATVPAERFHISKNANCIPCKFPIFVGTAHAYLRIPQGRKVPLTDSVNQIRGATVGNGAERRDSPDRAARCVLRTGAEVLGRSTTAMCFCLARTTSCSTTGYFKRICRDRSCATCSRRQSCSIVI